ncbi:MAG TPA: hypothetical protein VFS40_01250 [Gemmatimonadales bacterium]|nr:hypothetical protein [Gemmatimonadales bacterium]
MRLGPKGWGRTAVSWVVVAGIAAVAVAVVGCKPREQAGTRGPDTTRTTPGPRQALAGVGGTCIDTAAVRRFGTSAQWADHSQGEEGTPIKDRKVWIVPPTSTPADSTRPLTEGWLLARLENVSNGVVPQAALGAGGHSYYWVQDCGAQGGRVAALVSAELTGYRIYHLELAQPDQHAHPVGWTEKPWPTPVAKGGSLTPKGATDTVAVEDTTTAAAQTYVTCAACSLGGWCRPS